MQKKNNIKKSTEAGKSQRRKTCKSNVCCLLTLDMFCLIIQILLAFVSDAELFCVERLQNKLSL